MARKSVLPAFIASLFCTGLLYGQGHSGMVIERLGVANVRSLPRSGAPGQQIHSSPVLMDDPELFQGQKLQAQNGGTGFPAAAITETPSSLSISMGFPGLTLSDTPGYVPPDTQVAAGINSGTTGVPGVNLVEMVHSTVRVYNGGGSTLTTADTCSFFCDFFTAVISDPIVR